MAHRLKPSEMNLDSRFFDAFASRPRPTAAQILRPTVSHDGDRLCALLATTTSTELSANDLRTEVEGNLWMLAPKAFRYFLPAFLHHSFASYPSVSVFVSELVSALTKPSRTDVEEALKRASQIPPGLGLPKETMKSLREQQMEWFDAGTPLAIFHERFDDLTPTEGAAILAFFVALQKTHGEDFPFKELVTAIDRHWAHYRDELATGT